MALTLSYGVPTTNPNFGCIFTEVIISPVIGNLKACLVEVKDLAKIAESISAIVMNTSWMLNMDAGTRRSYNKTVQQTAQVLLTIFNSVASSNQINKEFGEIMVSLCSSQALNNIFAHISLPIAELWKPQLKQNEGFDYHTVCANHLLNFGEAKYSSTVNPHGNAISQIDGFINEEKHLRDRVHLINIAPPIAISNLDNDDFGIIAAFSINSPNPLPIIGHAINTAVATFRTSNVKMIYVVGVSK